MVSLGIHPVEASASRTYTLYPWVTSGCQCSQNDFDRDTNDGNTGSVTYTSRSGNFTESMASTKPLSINNDWAHNNITRWGDDDESDDYGIWEWEPTISRYNNDNGVNGNYETAYVGSYLAPVANPTSNPITSGGFPATFRLYLPTDAGLAPVKPYLEQFLTHNRNFTGANPPQVGVTSTFTVTIRFTNPTTRAITFNASNLISTNIPGGGAVYGGNSQVSQGSVVTQPAVAGTGVITWNPGSVAAGATILLSYDVRVTPTSAGQRILVTPAPATATSTRAQFIDETGNTTQSRARYLMGGLCELAVTQGLLTEVTLASFESDSRGRIHWVTASEAGTIGFNLYREDGTRVNESLIPAGQHQYGLEDRLGGGMYVLEEVMASGKKNRLGPFTSMHRLGPDVAEDVGARRQFRAQADARVDAGMGIDVAAKSAVAVMVGVRETGIVRVAFAELASRLGRPLPNIEACARKGDLSVKSNGQAVGWTATNDAILFFGEKSDSIYSAERVYRIEQVRGEKMTIVPVTGAASPVSTVSMRLDVENDLLPATVLPLDPEGDFWFWDFVISGDATYGRKMFAVEVPSIASSSGASLEVRLQGAFAGGDHRARITMNGVPVGDVSWKALDARTAIISIPGGVLRDGANEVIVEGALVGDAAFDVFYVDGFTVRYDRIARPVNGALEANARGAVVAGPFTSVPIALDVTNRLRPTLLSGGTFNRGNASLALPSTTRTVFIAERFIAPTSYRSSSAPVLRSQRADYVVIAPAAMRSGAEALAALRQRDGLQPLVVDLEQIYDEFSNGSPTPLAIRAFIGTALKWTQRPRYVVLAGTGTFDYRGITQPPGPIPPMLIKTADGLFASDVSIADVNGNGVPDVAIGRIPVASSNELLSYVSKLSRHSGSAGERPIIFSADATDQAANFGQSSDETAQPMLSRPISRIYVDQLGAVGARDALLSQWQNSTALLSWIGHGGLDQISSAGILTSGDLPSLQTAGRLPVVVAMTCTINRFELGFLEPLGAALTSDPDGGALAVWSASGLSVHASARQMQSTFMRLASQKPQARIGDLMLQTYVLEPSATSGIYVLLGDPAIVLDLPKEKKPTAPSSSSRE
jgi:hypothetical protein